MDKAREAIPNVEYIETVDIPVNTPHIQSQILRIIIKLDLKGSNNQLIRQALSFLIIRMNS